MSIDIIQATPKRSTSIPKSPPQGAGARGIVAVPAVRVSVEEPEAFLDAVRVHIR